MRFFSTAVNRVASQVLQAMKLVSCRKNKLTEKLTRGDQKRLNELVHQRQLPDTKKKNITLLQPQSGT